MKQKLLMSGKYITDEIHNLVRTSVKISATAPPQLRIDTANILQMRFTYELLLHGHVGHLFLDNM